MSTYPPVIKSTINTQTKDPHFTFPWSHFSPRVRLRFFKGLHFLPSKDWFYYSYPVSQLSQKSQWIPFASTSFITPSPQSVITTFYRVLPSEIDFPLSFSDLWQRIIARHPNTLQPYSPANKFYHHRLLESARNIQVPQPRLETRF